MDEDRSQREHRRRPVVYGAGLVLASLLGFTADLALIRTPPAISAPVSAPSQPEPVPGVPAPAGGPTTPRAETAPASHHIRGTVLDAGRRTPLRGASVWAGQHEAVTDADGRFALDVPAETTLIVKMPGYEMRRVPAVDLDAVALKPKSIRAAYLTYYGIAEPSIRNRVLELVDRTELNAVVIDVKGDRGLIPYRTEVPAALDAGALGPVIIKDFDGMLRSFRERGIYTIARVVAFKDNVLAVHRPDLAVIDTRTGKPWVDNEKLAWVDPFREEVWDYLIAIAKEAVAKGFDEVQFDYVRFPTDGRLSAAAYAQPNTSATRLPAIAAFLAKARRELGPTGAFLGADVFGYTAFNANDTDIGQRVEELAPHLDYICPMVYPSGYHLGIPGFRNPVTHPYEIVRESVRLIRQRTQHTAVQVRPWLQDFRDYAFDRRIFGTREIRAQIKGASDGGGVGFMLWNPRNDYTAQALLPKAVAASTTVAVPTTVAAPTTGASTTVAIPKPGAVPTTLAVPKTIAPPKKVAVPKAVSTKRPPG